LFFHFAFSLLPFTFYFGVSSAADPDPSRASPSILPSSLAATCSMNPIEKSKRCDRRDADPQEKHSAEGNASLHQGMRPKARRQEPPIHVERLQRRNPQRHVAQHGANLGDLERG